MAQDVTDAKVAQKQAVNTAAELLQLIEKAHAPIFGTDTEKNVSEWNAMTERITGFAKSEAEGVKFVDFVEPAFHSSVNEVFDKALRGEPTTNYSLKFRRVYNSNSNCQRRIITASSSGAYTLYCAAEGRLFIRPLPRLGPAAPPYLINTCARSSPHVAPPSGVRGAACARPTRARSSPHRADSLRARCYMRLTHTLRRASTLLSMCSRTAAQQDEERGLETPPRERRHSARR